MHRGGVTLSYDDIFSEVSPRASPSAFLVPSTGRSLSFGAVRSNLVAVVQQLGTGPEYARGSELTETSTDSKSYLSSSLGVNVVVQSPQSAMLVPDFAILRSWR